MEHDFFYIEAFEEGHKQKLKLYGVNGIKIIDAPFKPYCYVPSYTQTGMAEQESHKPVKKMMFDTETDVRKFMWNSNSSYEADLSYVRRCMLDLNWKIGTVKKAYVDIEVSDKNGIPNADRDPVICIGIIFDDGREVYLEADEGFEANMLDQFVLLMADVGMIITYNGGTDIWQDRSFDLPYLSKRFVSRPMFNRELKHCAFVDLYQTYKYEVGRIGKSLGGGYGLDNVCKHELGKGKIQHTKRFGEMSKEELREYNMHDVRLLKELDEKFSFTDAMIDMARMTNLCLVSWRKEQKYSEMRPMILIDQLLLQEAKKLNLVWHNREFSDEEQKIEGAMVFEPKVGVHKQVQNFDVRQMYPNIMLHEKVSPDMRREIIPNIIQNLTKQRQELKARYKQSGSKADFIRQYNIKILANTIYGGFANRSSRIHNAEMAGFITRTGRKILRKISDKAKELGYDTVYGDTDSVFLQVNKDKADWLCETINQSIAPYEIEAGEFYEAIIFTGSESKGAKKRHAGLESNGNLKVVGLEAVKRNYTVLARETQLLILTKLLSGVSVRECDKCVRNIQRVLPTGAYDNKLVITKGVKELSEYKVEQPHVRALRKARSMGYGDMYDISYVHTTCLLYTSPSPRDS